MNIGYDAYKALNSSGPEGAYSRNLIQIFSGYHPENQFFLFSRKSGRYNTKDFAGPNAPMKMIFPEEMLHKFFPWYWEQIAIGKQIFSNRIQIFHGLSGDVPEKLPPGPKATKIISLHRLKELTKLEGLGRWERQSLKNKYESKIKKADFVILPSHYASSICIENLNIPERKIFVAGYPIPEIFFNETEELPKGDPFYYLPKDFILCPASSDKESNVLLLLEAYQKLFLSGKTLLPLFVVTRENSYTTLIKEKIRDLKIDKKVFCLPKVNYYLSCYLYQKAELVVLPFSLDTNGQHLLEAIAASANILVSDIPVHREFSNPQTPMFDPGSLDDMMRLFCAFFDNPNLFRNKQNQEEINSLPFHPQNFAGRLESFYRSVI